MYAQVENNNFHYLIAQAFIAFFIIVGLLRIAHADCIGGVGADDIVISDKTPDYYNFGDIVDCVATSSITLGPDVTIPNGVVFKLVAPNVYIKTNVEVLLGSQLHISPKKHTSIQATGQVTSFYPGDDGDLRVGIPWNVFGRFSDNGDGTLTDTLTGLMWLKNANCAAASGYDPDLTGDGHITWESAMSFSEDINSGTHDISACDDYSANYTDWRVPNLNEIDTLADFESCGMRWTATVGFSNVPPFDDYWTSTALIENNEHFMTSNGYASYKINLRWVLLVRGQAMGAVIPWKTGQTEVRHARDDGDLQYGATWPTPRFLDNGDGTISDRLTGLIWLKDANCAATIAFDPNGTGDGSMTWTQALDFVSDVNSKNHDINACSSYNASYSDWRVPNIRELRTLLDYSQSRPALPADHLFENVKYDRYYTSSTTYLLLPSNAMQIDFALPWVSTYPKTDPFYVWPVR